MRANDLSSILRAITGLLNKADGTDNEHEKALFQEHAEKLMRKYRIDQEQLLAEDPHAAEPIHEVIDICTDGSAFAGNYHQLLYWCVEHAEVRYHPVWEPNDDRVWTLRAHVVGYDGDVRIAALLYASARMVFQERLEPQIKPDLSDAENVYRLRTAGVERNKIARLLWGEDTHSSHARVGRLYREECGRRGEDAAVSGRKVNAKTYREAYGAEFTSTFARRLRRARDAADMNVGTMVLAGRKERVDEAFYTLFPSRRPLPTPANLRPAKTPRPFKVSKATQDQYNRLHRSASAQAGRGAGERAAAEIDLSRPGTRKLDQHDAEDMKMVRQIQAWSNE